MRTDCIHGIIISFCILKEHHLRSKWPGQKTPLSHLNEILALAGSSACVEVGGLGLAAGAQLAAKTVMESHRSLALHWNYLSRCQDLTVYPHMSPCAGANPQTPAGKGLHVRTAHWRLRKRTKDSPCDDLR